jgi:uncharacterized protein YdcH (DUF465 family)
VEKRDLELIKSLVGKNDELRVLMEEHRELEKTLDTIQQKRYLSADEEVAKKNIQKLKLAGRDRIEEILSSYR